jgi:hypothetical protein
VTTPSKKVLSAAAIVRGPYCFENSSLASAQVCRRMIW